VNAEETRADPHATLIVNATVGEVRAYTHSEKRSLASARVLTALTEHDGVKGAVMLHVPTQACCSSSSSLVLTSTNHCSCL
jgi:hypothetical protein